jgi:Helix-turn-helix
VVTSHCHPARSPGRPPRAAGVFAGDVSVRDAALKAGLSHRYLVAVETGRARLLPTDCADLSRGLGVPGEWLRDGWTR